MRGRFGFWRRSGGRYRLDYRDVIRRVDQASDQVDIWKYWTGLLEPRYEPAFTSAMLAALERGVHFRIMLTDPSCPDAAERARQVNPTDAVALMRQNIKRLDEILQKVPARHAELLQVRISSVGPAHAFYRVDVNPATVSHPFHLDHEVSLAAEGWKRYVLVGASPETQQRVAALYAAKYGPDQAAVLLRLIDR